MTSNRIASLAVGLAVAVLAQGAAAQAWPTKPIRLVVPFSAGGANDLMARAAAEGASKQLGQPVIVDNKPGAGAVLGADVVAKSAPDGYTFLVSAAGVVSNSMIKKSMPYKDEALVPVAMIGLAPSVIVVPANAPYKDLKEFVAASKKSANGFHWATAGTGSTPHLAGELLKARTGANFVHVPYKGGGQSMTDVVGGSLPMLYTAVAGAYPFVQKGQIRPIAVSSAQRLASLPEVPTVAESGVAGFESSSWIGILAPAKTPQPIVERLQRELHAVVQSPEVRERLASLGISALGNTPAEFGQQIRADLAKYDQIVKAAKVRVD